MSVPVASDEQTRLRCDSLANSVSHGCSLSPVQTFIDSELEALQNGELRSER